MNYKMINNLLGWLTFLVALVVYTMTLEPSVSLWDCGEFISASYKLQVVHPPGAPMFLLFGRLFSMFAGEPTGVAVAVNMLSAVTSALTVLFTFWITTHFAKKMVKDDGSASNRIAIFGSGIVAALALTFSDSFWFSAVEAEVYAMSSFFTALTFWATLRWEESESQYADKWLILIAYLVGLAVGTHLLSLLVIPTVAYIYYFKHYTMTRKGLIYTGLIGLAVLFFIQNGVIPGIPNLMAKMDLIFVNSFGLPFNSGSMFAILLLVAGTAYGIYHFGFVKKNRVVNLAFICFAYVLLGYSSYTMVVVRSMDNPAIDMNNPEEPFNLLSYINREQYGDRPLLYGPYFNAVPADDDNDGFYDVKEGKAIYRKDSTVYTQIGNRNEYKYEKEYSTLFPRMGDQDKESSPNGYRSWGGMADVSSQIELKQQQFGQTQDPAEKKRINDEINDLKRTKPSMGNNISFLVSYQLGHMYFRYFMWNFAGRQNDQQGHDFNRTVEGNWISGINMLDDLRLGPQTKLPDYMANNKARNKFYFIPLILGVLGLVFHFKKGKTDAIVTSVLFLFTGILIIIFLNQPPFEPRERDYAMVGSFQTFCIWIGLGVLFIWEKLKGKMSGAMAAMLAAIIALSAPALMGTQGWDDHDRSDRYLGIDFAKNYLNSCPQNAILFTNGDNDTYPLWYAQNVEGIRTDIRIINQSLLPTDWYSQVLLNKVYDSEALPLTLTKNQLAAGINDMFEFQDAKDYAPKLLSSFIHDLVNSKQSTFGHRKFRVPVDKNAVLKSGVVDVKDTALIVKDIFIDFPGRRLNKGELVLMDLIATNAATGWKRPICFSTTSGDDGYLGMQAYFERKGLIYQLVPIKSDVQRGDVSRINLDNMYDMLMNKFRYSGIKEKKDFSMDDKSSILPYAMQKMFIYTSYEYINKVNQLKVTDSMLTQPGNKALADAYNKKVIDLINKCKTELPDRALPTKADIRYYMADLLHQAGDTKAGEEELRSLYEYCNKDVAYYLQFKGSKKYRYMMEMCKDAYDFMERAQYVANEWKLKDLADKWARSNKELKSAVESYLTLE